MPDASFAVSPSAMDSRYFDVDRNGAIRVPGILWVSLAILGRHWVLMLVLLASARGGGAIAGSVRDSFNWIVMALEIPALALAFAGANRVPQAGALPRRVWRHGRIFVALAVISNLAYAGWYLYQSESWMPWPELFLASMCLLDLAIVSAVVRDPFYRHLFADFPAPPMEEPKS